MFSAFLNKILRKEVKLKVHMFMHHASGTRVRVTYVREGLAYGELFPISKLNKKLEALTQRFELKGWPEQEAGRAWKWVHPEDPKCFFCFWAD